MKSSLRRLVADATATATVLLCTFSTTTLALATTQSSFRDIGNDVYAKEIQEAVETGLITGFSEDNTFRPQVSLTREQMVSMMLETLSKLPVSPLTVPYDPPSTSFLEVTAKPYRDVEATRWSAAKIKWAQDNKVVLGYSDGTFRPTQPATRSELIAVLHRAAEYGKVTQGSDSQLFPTQPPITFSDTSNHWANSLIAQMSSYCGVASPLNETGNTFAPDSAVRRNYAAAATLRMLHCIKGERRHNGG